MRTEEKILELHAQLTESKMREDNLLLQICDLKKDVTQRNNYIQSLKSKEQRMENLLEMADEEKRAVVAELMEVKFTLQRKEQQLDRLDNEIRSLKMQLTLKKELNQDKDLEVSMLKQALQRYEMKVERQKTTISDRFQENEILKAQLEAKAQRFRETLEQENGIVQLKQNLDYYLLHKKEFLEKLRYCKDCQSTDQKLKEFESIRRDYNRMKEENIELNEKMVRCTEENNHLKLKIMSVEPSEIDRALKKNVFGYHQMFNNSTPVSQKRQIEERSESPRKRVYFDRRNEEELSDNSNILAPDSGNDRPSRKGDYSCNRDRCRAENSCRPDTSSCHYHATSCSDRTPATDTAKNDTATEDRNELSLAEAGCKGEQTIIGDRLMELEKKESQGNSAEIEAHTDNPNSTEPTLIDLSESINVNDDCEADKEDECGRSESLDDDSDAENKSPSNDDPSAERPFLKPLSQYGKHSNASQSQIPKRNQTK